MSVDFNSKPMTEPGLGESDTPMFAGIPSWERNRKRRTFGGKPRAAAAEPVAPRNAADVPPRDIAFAAAPVYGARTVRKNGGGVAPLAIAAGIVAIAAGRGRLVRRPAARDRHRPAHPGTESVAPPATSSELAVNATPLPGEPTSAAPAATPAAAETPTPRVTTRVASATPVRVRPAASRSVEDAGVNASATLPGRAATL